MSMDSMNNHLECNPAQTIRTIRQLNFTLRYLSDEAKKEINETDDGTVEELIDELEYVLNPLKPEDIRAGVNVEQWKEFLKKGAK